MSDNQHSSEEKVDKEYQDFVPWHSDEQIIQKDATTTDMIELGLQVFEVKNC